MRLTQLVDAANAPTAADMAREEARRRPPSPETASPRASECVAETAFARVTACRTLEDVGAVAALAFFDAVPVAGIRAVVLQASTTLVGACIVCNSLTDADGGAAGQTPLLTICRAV